MTELCGDYLGVDCFLYRDHQGPHQPQKRDEPLSPDWYDLNFIVTEDYEEALLDFEYAMKGSYG